MTDTDEIERLRALWCEEKSKAMTFHAEIERLRAEVARVTADRDEARRMACEYEARYEEERCYPLDPPDEGNIQRDTRRIAAERSWDCFAKEEE